MEFEKCNSEILKYQYIKNNVYHSKDKSHSIFIEKLVCMVKDNFEYEIQVNYNNQKTSIDGTISLSDFFDRYEA